MKLLILLAKTQLRLLKHLAVRENHACVKSNVIIKRRIHTLSNCNCNNDAELGHIVEYFRMRTRIGEKPLIL